MGRRPSARSGARPDARSSALPCALLVALAVVAYANSFSGVFLYDDFDSITNNPHIRSLWPLSDAMSRPLAAEAETVSTRPLLSLTFALNLALLGPGVGGFHAVNLAIHAAAACFLFAWLQRTMMVPALRERLPASPRALAFAVAALWVVHPLQTSSVTYIVQRAESLAGLLFFAALYCASRALEDRAARGWKAATVLLCAVGMGVKETMAAAPIAILVYDATFAAGGYAAALTRRRGWYAALAATWLIIAALLAPDTGELADGGDGFAYLLSQPGVILHYLRLSVWPSPLVMSYEWPTPAGVAEIALPLLILVGLIGAGAAAVVRRHPAGVLAVMFFAVLAPSSSIFALTQRIMEHRMYVPLAAVLVVLVVGAAAGLATLGSRAAAGHGPAGRGPVLSIGAPLLVLCILALAALTHARNRTYHDEIVFWTHNVEHRPDNYIAYLQLGRAQTREGHYEEATASLTRAVELEPTWAVSRNALARALIGGGDLEAAERELTEAVALDPGFALAHNNLGVVHERSGRHAQAISAYRAAVEADPDLLLTTANLVRVLLMTRQLDQAEIELRRIVAVQPGNADAHANLGAVLAERGDLAGARVHLEISLEHSPDNAAARANLDHVLRDSAR